MTRSTQQLAKMRQEDLLKEAQRRVWSGRMRRPAAQSPRIVRVLRLQRP